MTHKRIKPARFSGLYKLDPLEGRAHLSVSVIGVEPCGFAAHAGNNVTPIADLTGNPLNFSQVVGLPAVQDNFLPAVQHFLPMDNPALPAVQRFLGDIA